MTMREKLITLATKMTMREKVITFCVYGAQIAFVAYCLVLIFRG
jgi:hypothetical protein